MDINRRHFIGLIAGAAACAPSLAMETAAPSEFERCRDDILYFLDNYLVVDGEVGGKLKMNDDQRRYLKRISTTTGHFACSKGRQVGISTANCVFAYWKSVFFEKGDVWIVCPNRGMCERTGNVYSTISDSGAFPPSIGRTHFVYPVALESLSFDDENNTFILDELAFWSDGCMERWRRGVMEQRLLDVSRKGCRFIATSTPYSPTDVFTAMYMVYPEGQKMVIPRMDIV
jgi:hypothetical protein